MRYLAAMVGVAALTLTGFVGATAATAAPGGNAELGNIDATLTGSITLHKHVDDANSTDNNPAGDALEGVVFQYQRITNIDLTTSAGWATIEAAYATQPNAAPNMTGLTLGAAVEMPGTSATGVTSVSGLAVGAYYVTEIRPGDNLITAEALPFIVTLPEPNANGTWNYNVVAYPKNDIGTVTPTKTVSSPSQAVGLGGTVDWTVTAPVPATEVGYDEFVISDALTPGLTFVDWESVSLGATPLAEFNGTSGDYTIDPVTHDIVFTTTGVNTLDSALEDGNVTIFAVIRTTVSQVGIHTNQANITVNGNVFPTNIPQTNWAALELTKVDAGNENTVLEGAQFSVYELDGNGDRTGAAIATGTTDATGEVHWDLYVGSDSDTTMTVEVEETVPPQGYVLPADPVVGTYTLTAGATVAASTTTDVIENYQPTAPQLPLTGSTGTLVFMILGFGLVAGGGGLLVARRMRSRA